MASRSPLPPGGGRQPRRVSRAAGGGAGEVAGAPRHHRRTRSARLGHLARGGPRAALGGGHQLPRAAGSPAELFELLNDRTRVEDDAVLPAGRSALPGEWERILSAPFVLHPEYGTRCSTVLLEAPHGGLYLAERRFDSRGEVVGETEFNLNPGEWP